MPNETDSKAILGQDIAPGDIANLGESSPTSNRLVLTIAFLLGLCMIGLTHAETYLEQHEDGVGVELGAGIEDHAKFEEDVNAAPAYRKLGFLGLLGIAAYCFFTAPRQVVIQPSIVLMLMGCCLFLVMASYFWSASRQETGRELVRVVAYAGVAFAFARRFQPRELLKVLSGMAIVSVFAACAVDVAMGGKPWAPDYRLHGTLHSNLLAHQALVVLLVSFALYKSSSKPWVWKSIFIAMLAVIVLTKTRGALASAIVGLGAITMIGRPFYSLLLTASFFGAVVTCAALLIVMSGSHTQQRLSETAMLGRSEGVGTLTGRIPLWEAVLEESRDNRLKGYGYGAFWNTDRTKKLSKQLQWFPGHSHSAYIQTLVDVGYFGAAFFLMLVFSALIRSAMLFFSTGKPEYKFVFGLLIAGLIDGLVEVSFVYPRELGLFVGVSLFMLVVGHPIANVAAVARDEPVGGDSTERGWNKTQFAY